MAAIQETMESRRVASPHYLVDPVMTHSPLPPEPSRANFRAKSENDVRAEMAHWPMKAFHRPGLGMDSSPIAAADTTLAARRKFALLRVSNVDSKHTAVELNNFRNKLADLEKRMLAAAATEDTATVKECLAAVRITRHMF